MMLSDMEEPPKDVQAYSDHESLSAQEREVLLEYWKKAVDVQQHFNDIEWRIRGLALTAATATIAAAGVVASNGVELWNWLSVGGIIAVLGLILWWSFYFVDCHWYHPLLKAAVASGEGYEKSIQDAIGIPGMTAAITVASAYEPGPLTSYVARKIKLGKPSDGGGAFVMRSGDKLRWFYLLGSVPLVLAALVFTAYALGSPVPTSPEAPTIIVTEPQKSP